MRILFSMVSVVKIETEQIELLVQSAKKYFLTNHEIDFVVFTDVKEKPIIEDVYFVEIDNSFSISKSYYQFQKILSLNYINLNVYEYIFVHDIDQLYVNQVNDEDLLSGDLCILNHFTSDKVKIALDWWSGIIDVDQDLQHTMGNFWGGPTHIIKLFLEFCNNFWDINKNFKNERVGFFSEHPEEIMLIKFIDFYRIKERRITCSIDFEIPAFLTSITINGAVHNHLQNFKLIHDTKVNIEWGKQLFFKSINFNYISNDKTNCR